MERREGSMVSPEFRLRPSLSVGPSSPLASALDNDIAMARSIFGVRLRSVRSVESETPQVRAECVEVDMGRGGSLHRKLLGQDIPAWFAKLLDLRRRRRAPGYLVRVGFIAAQGIPSLGEAALR